MAPLIEDEPNSSHFEKHGRWEVAGHDFWLSRNGHGAGFFDGDWPENGDKLQAAAEKYGQVDLQVDDGVISDGIHWTPAGTSEARRRPMARAGKHVMASGNLPPEVERVAAFAQKSADSLSPSMAKKAVYVEHRPDGSWEISDNFERFSDLILVFKDGQWKTRYMYGDYPGRNISQAEAEANAKLMFTDTQGSEEMRQTNHRVADFSTIPELISHAQQEGATHVKTDGDETKLYFPRPDGQYEEACVWTEGGYWHTHAPGNRVILGCLPPGAEPIEGQVVTSNRRHTVRDYVAVDNHGRQLAGPFKDYGTAKQHADRAVRERVEASREIQHEPWLCQDCMFVAVNGDTSGMSDERAAEVEVGLDQLTARVGWISPNFDEETGDGFNDFTNQPCASCGTRLAGSRYRFASFGKEGLTEARQKEQPYQVVFTTQHGTIEGWIWASSERQAKRRLEDEMGGDCTLRSIKIDRSGHAPHPGEHEHSRGSKYFVRKLPGMQEFNTVMAPRRKQAPSDEKIGAQYAQDQIGGEHFMIWVGDQIYEAEEMERREPGSTFPLKTRADYRKLARNMLQQLEWDTKRQIDTSEIHHLGASDPKAFLAGFVEELKSDTSVNWLADEIEAMHKSGRGEVTETRRLPIAHTAHATRRRPPPRPASTRRLAPTRRR